MRYPLLLVFAALFVLLWLQKPDLSALAWPVILLLGGLGANFAMILSPFYYERSTHGVFSLLTVACAACLAQLNGLPLRRLAAMAAACVSLVCVFDLFGAGYDIASYWMMSRTRETLILAEAARNDGAAIVTYGIEPYTRWCGAYGLPDIRENGEDSIALAPGQVVRGGGADRPGGPHLPLPRPHQRGIRGRPGGERRF